MVTNKRFRPFKFNNPRKKGNHVPDFVPVPNKKMKANTKTQHDSMKHTQTK